MNLRCMGRIGPNTTHSMRKVVIMGTEEQKGKSITFDSFESDAQEHISVESAKAQEAKAAKARAAESK